MTASTKAVGILCWPANERRSDRYGVIGLYDTNSNLDARCVPDVNKAAIRAMVGRQATITATVLESRVSGHIGDIFRGISPTQPAVGEKIDLGTGELFVEDLANDTLGVGLMPADGRDADWFDPTKLYRLHDQTVVLTITTIGD